MKKKTKPNKKNKAKKKFILKIIALVILLGIIISSAFLYFSGIGGKLFHLYIEAHELVTNSDKNTFKASQTSQVYDTNGELITTLSGDKNVYYLPLDKIPKKVQQAFISIEDKKFYSHHGIDYKAILRAALSYLKHGEITQGGSTITQQLSRNVFLSHAVTWSRKIEEIFIARKLERKYSKDEILEFYINNIFYANGHYGIQAASKGYFNKDVSELSLSQIAFLCAIPNNPTLYNPVHHPENTIKRRDRILKQMKLDGYIDEKTYKAAIAEEIVLNIPESEHVNYVETFVYHCATKVIMEENGFDFRYAFRSDSDRKAYKESYDSAYNTAQKALYTAGYQIHTSIDMDIQQQLQAAIDDELSEFTATSEEGIYQLQSAATCIDNSTGYVKAIVGGRSQDVSGYTLNRAYQSFRQPGSSIKPLIVYTPCLERDYTANSKVTDSKEKDGPSNSDGKYEGSISLRRAVAKSKNTVAWKLFRELTPKVGLSYLQKMEFSNIVDGDNTLSSSLGGLTKGASTLEMASAFATIANDGNFRSPTCIVFISDSEGNIVYGSRRSEVRVYKKNAARNMTNILESVMTEGTGRGLALKKMACAGKTGTTNNNKDGWFVGYTPYYTTAVWVGYDMPKKVPGLSGASYPGAVWKTFMANIHKDLEKKSFLKSSNSSSNKETPSMIPEPTMNPSIPPSVAPVTETPTPAPSEEPTTIPTSEEPSAPASEEPTPAPTGQEPEVISEQ